MSSQNQNINPDYSFILNKPGPPVKKSKFSKRLIIVVVLCAVILVGLAIVGTIVANNNKKLSGVGTAYVQALGAKNYEQAYGYYSSNYAKKVDKTGFVDVLGPGIADLLKTDTCTVVVAGRNSSRQKQELVSCQNQKGGTTQMLLSITNGSPKKIDTIVWSNK
jgi:hypothetical protein